MKYRKQRRQTCTFLGRRQNKKEKKNRETTIGNKIIHQPPSRVAPREREYSVTFNNTMK